MGDAPTVPGIKERFSNPAQSSAMLCRTNSCHISPAPTSTQSWSPSSLTRLMPLISSLITSPSISRVNKMLLPPPKMNTGSCFSFAASKAAFNSSKVSTVVKNLAFLSIPKVVKGFKEMFSCIFMGQNLICELKKFLRHCEMESQKDLLKYERINHSRSTSTGRGKSKH